MQRFEEGLYIKRCLLEWSMQCRQEPFWVGPLMPAIYHIFSDQFEIGLKLFCEKTVIKGGSSFQEEMLLNHKLPESEGQ